MPDPLIALVSDFGSDDPYVGIMKAIVKSISPQTSLIDLTHEVPPGDIQRGAFVVWQAAKDLPKGTILLAVIDPGVGSERKAIYLKCQGQTFIGPDNGLFSYLFPGNKYDAWELTNPEFQLPNPSSTFHGRDIFSPAAAYAANGTNSNQFGSPIDTLQEIPKPKLAVSKSSIQGEILSHDKFGNLFTSLGLFQYSNNKLRFNSWLNSEKIDISDFSNLNIQTKDHNLTLAKTFSDVAMGSCAGLIGSTGLLEIVANQDSAMTVLNLQEGDSVNLYW